MLCSDARCTGMHIIQKQLMYITKYFTQNTHWCLYYVVCCCYSCVITTTLDPTQQDIHVIIHHQWLPLTIIYSSSNYELLPKSGQGTLFWSSHVSRYILS